MIITFHRRHLEIIFKYARLLLEDPILPLLIKTPYKRDKLSERDHLNFCKLSLARLYLVQKSWHLIRPSNISHVTGVIIQISLANQKQIMLVDVAWFVMVKHFEHNSEHLKVVSLIRRCLVYFLLVTLLVWVYSNTILVELELLVRWAGHPGAIWLLAGSVLLSLVLLHFLLNPISQIINILLGWKHWFNSCLFSRLFVLNIKNLSIVICLFDHLFLFNFLLLRGHLFFIFLFGKHTVSGLMLRVLVFFFNFRDLSLQNSNFHILYK